ncbi:MAG: hypothetical protein H0V30_04500 [Chitinophagaceae bacterium]|jgi:hypothetical protein|nr:hypothetical protein [Chitinophagaceae bacterium]
MVPISTSKDLQQRIAELEQKKLLQEYELKDQAQKTMEALKPGNMISHAFHQPGMKGKLVNASLGLLTGYLSKRIFLGPASGPVSKVAGDMLQWGMAAFTGSKADMIKQKVGQFLRKAKFKN